MPAIPAPMMATFLNFASGLVVKIGLDNGMNGFSQGCARVVV
jgi:hypothetical protein